MVLNVHGFPGICCRSSSSSCLVCPMVISARIPFRNIEKQIWTCCLLVFSGKQGILISFLAFFPVLTTHAKMADTNTII